MRKTLLFLFIFLLASAGYSQKTNTEFFGRYFRVGWHTCGMTLKGLNSSIDYYNQNRPWLSENMGHFGLMQGPAFGFGYQWEALSMELLWSNQHDIVHAAGTEPISGNFAKRDLKIRFNCWSYALSFPIAKSDAFFWGISIDWGNVRTFTKTDTADAYSWKDKNFYVCDRLFVNFDIPIGGPFQIQIQPYVQIPFLYMIGCRFDQTYGLLRDEQYGSYDGCQPMSFGGIVTLKLGKRD